jgi:hypothetical protein
LPQGGEVTPPLPHFLWRIDMPDSFHVMRSHIRQNKENIRKTIINKFEINTNKKHKNKKHKKSVFTKFYKLEFDYYLIRHVSYCHIEFSTRIIRNMDVVIWRSIDKDIE